MAKNDRQMRIIIKVKDIGSRVLKTITRSFVRLGKTIKGIGRSFTSLKALGAGLFVGFGIKKALDSFQRLDATMKGLGSIAKATGVDMADAQKAAQDLAADGLATVAETAQGLKNLLSAGFGLQKSIDLMRAFKDSAAFGRQAALGFGESIVGATEGLKNNNSMLVDNAGVTKNLSVLHKEYATTIGTTVGKLTQAQKRQAEYVGILQETKNQAGDALKATEGYGGQVAKLNTKLQTMLQTVGEKLAPVVSKFIKNAVIPAIEAFTKWFKSSETINTALNWITETLKDIQRVGFENWIDGLVAKMKEAIKPILEFASTMNKAFSFIREVTDFVGLTDEAPKGPVRDFGTFRGTASGSRDLGTVGNEIGPARGRNLGTIGPNGEQTSPDIGGARESMTVLKGDWINAGNPQPQLKGG